MGCTSCGSSKSTTGKPKSSTPKSMSGMSKAKTYSSNGINTYGKPRITFSSKNR